MPAQAATLEISALAKVYPTLRRAVDGITLTLGEGVFGLLGPNGAGKTSMMEILAGNLDFEGGSATLGGVTDLRRNRAAWRARLGYMPQHFDFPPNLTGREVLQEGALLLGHSPRTLRPRMEALIDRVNLRWAIDREAARYSRGMKQRLGIALALLCDPALLLLDEPTAGLDPEERVFFRELLAESARGRVVILSTHIVSDIERMCSRIGVIGAGQLLYDGSPGELTRRIAGRVWEFPIPAEDVDRWVATRQVVSITDREGQAFARLIAEGPPDGARAIESPTLEDAYLGLLSAVEPAWGPTP